MTWDPTWPTPEPPMPPAPAPRRSWFGRLPRAALAGGLAAGLALGGAGIAYAASSSSSTPTTTPGTPDSPVPDGHAFGHRFGPGGPGLGFGRVLHGQFTIAQGSGYKTVEVQSGTASGVSSSSVTVTSADHYQHTYAVTSSTMVNAQRDGISSVAKGDQVRILATTVNGKDTAYSIVDITKMGDSHRAFGFGDPRPADGSAGAAAPTD